MKKFYSFFNLFVFLTFTTLLAPFSGAAQCPFVNTGPASDPSCNYQVLSGGAGQFWTINVVNGVNYSFYVSTSCGDVDGLCAGGTHLTGGTVVNPSTISAGSSTSWDIGFYESNTTWCGTSSTLSYKVTTPVVTQGPTTSATVCASTNTYTIPAGYSTTVGNISWSTTGDGTFNFGNTTTPTYVFGAADKSTGGLITLVMTADNGGCTASKNFSLTIGVAPTTASVGPTQNICGSTTSGSLGGDPATVGTGVWSQTSGPSSSTFNPSASSPAASASALAYGSYQYTWTISNGAICPPSSASVSVNYYPTPSAASVGPNQNICGSLTSNSLGGNIPASGTGTWTQLSGPGTTTFGNAHLGSTTATASQVGTYQYTWTIASGTCPSSSATITVNYYNNPTTASAGPQQNICGSLTSGNLGGNTAIIGTGAWSETSGPGTVFFSNGASGSSTASVSAPGTYILTWTITNGTCTSAANDTLNFYATPTPATVGPTQNICGSLTSGSLGGNNPAAGSGLWTQTSGPGTTTFSYADSGDATATVSVVGNYVYTWTISNGTCATSSASIAVNFAATPTGGSIANTSYCASAGSGTVSVTGVSNASEYQWSLPAGLSGSSGTSTINVGGSIGGVYIVTVTPIDTAFGVTCAGAPITGQVTILSLPVIDSVNTHSIVCYGSANDTIFVYATTTNGNLFYSIDGGTTYPNSTGIFTGIGVGNYNVFVQDDSSCGVGYAQNPVKITQTAVPLSATSIVTPVGCNNDSNGTINLLASGGSGGYLYSWSSGQSTQIISGLGAGTYVGIVTDDNGCQATVSDTLINPTPIFTSITSTNVTCYGEGNGTASLTISGGVAPYAILWSNFDTTSDIANLAAGLYRVRVTDAYGCEHSDSIRISRPQLLTGTLSVTNVSCYGSNIDSIVVNVTGGNAGGYTYTWSPSVSTSASAVDIAPGTYYVTVSDSRGCQFIDSATITQPLTALYATSIMTNVKCANDSNGIINILASGGVGGYTYNWSSGQTIQDISGLPSGTYAATVTDANGCTVSVSDTLVNPAPLFSILETTNVTCYGLANGQGGPSVTGGVPPYTYLWNNFDTDQYLYNLAPGQYGVIVTDANGCKQIDTASVQQPAQLIATVSVTNIGCSGNNTGSVVVTVTGGTTASGTYSYSWSPVASSTDSVSGVGPGTYTVTATDDNSCSVTASGTVIQTGSALALSSTLTNVTCNNAANGAISVYASGGSIGYTYSWSGGQSTPAISGLSAGIYTVTVTSGTGCSASLSDTLVNPAPLVTSITGTNVTCYGAGNGQASLSVSGGVAPYTILWSNDDTSFVAGGLSAGQYGVIITDSFGCKQVDTISITQPQALAATIAVTNIGCSGSNTGSVVVTVTGGTPGAGGYNYTWSPVASNTDSVSGVGPGTYTVTATDANGCGISASGTVIQTGSALALTSTVTNVTCNNDSNGAISVYASGGSIGYTYSWSGGQSTPNITGLSAGIYTVTVTSGTGCSASLSDTLSNPARLVTGITGTNLSCYGSGNGQASVTVSGGEAPYTILWTNYDTSYTAGGLSAGQYGAMITDANGCKQIDTVTITQPQQLAATVAVTNIGCSGNNTGSVVVTVTGGTPAAGGYTYTWSPVASSTDSVSGVGPGTYTVTASDANGCSITASGTVIQTGSALALSSSVTNITCNNDNNGAISVYASGGTIGYTYSWSGGQSTPTISGLSAGIYTVTATSGTGCSASLSDTLVNPTLLITNIAATNVTCYGAGNGQAILTVSGGEAPYTILWSNDDTSYVAGGLSAGQYGVIVTDSFGCKQVDTISIMQPQQLAATIAVRNVGCSGNSTGSVVVTVTGGTPGVAGYSYTWSPVSSSTDSVSGVGPGTYYVTVTDAHGCQLTDSATITQPLSMLSISDIVSPITCHNSDNGSITILASGGSGGYTYSWTGTNQTTSTITALSAGTYTVTVADANGCSASLSNTLTNPSTIISGLSGTNVTCAGAANGSASLTVSGGTPGYTFLWSNFDTSQNIGSLGGGLYRVIITDANGCKGYDSIIITEPQPLVATVTVRNIGCSGGNTGSVVVNVSGGTPAYSYAWSSTGSTVDSVSGVGAGTYTVTITDANSCTITASGTVTQIASNLSAVSVATNITCYNENNGTITVLPSGGSGGYTYAWTGTAQTTSTITGLSAGTYTVTVTDGNGCTTSLSNTITNPSAIVSSIAGTNVTCAGANNGSAVLTVSGGTPGYTYLWSNFDTAQNQTNIGGGLYRVIITDANGCKNYDSIIIAEPQPLVATVTVRNTGCSGGNTGSVVVNVTGGTAPYTYAWSSTGSTVDSVSNVGPGTYTVTITDGHSCSITASGTVIQPASTLSANSIVTDMTCHDADNGSITVLASGGSGGYTYAWTGTAQTSSTITGLSAGAYTVTVTDGSGCTTSLTDTIHNPAAIISNVTGTNVTCAGANNGSASVTVSGGASPYTFLWSNFSGSQNIDSLSGGWYYVIITDAHGCEHRDSVKVLEPQPLVATDSVSPVSCNNGSNGSIILRVSGGTGSDTYTWTPAGPNSPNNTGLAAGTYSVTVSDQNSCKTSLTVTLINPTLLTVSHIATAPRCNGDMNALIDLFAIGGTPQYTYSWSPNEPNSSSIANLGAGTYLVTVTDAHGCTADDSIVITQPSPMYVSGLQKNITCYNDNDGYILPTPYGGTLPYSYQWYLGSDTFAPAGPITENITNLAGGNYYLIVTDANGCMVPFTRTIVNPDSLIVNLTKNNLTCAGANSGTVAVVVSGGTMPYQYLWNNFTTDSFQTGVGAGTYTVIVTDSNGCHKNQSIVVNQSTPIAILGRVTDPSCSGGNDGSVTLTVSGGIPQYTYLWNGGQTTASITGLSSGLYVVTVTDSAGCSQTDSFVLTGPATLYVNTAVSDPTCSGGDNGFVSLDAHGGTAPYQYVWNTNPAQSGNVASALGAGTYYATITDSKGCMLYDTAIVTAPQPIVVAQGLGSSTCAGAAGGTVIVIATGGLAPYNYGLGNTIQTSDTFSGLSVGSYTIAVTDANGCVGTAPVSVSAIGTFTDTLTATPSIVMAGQAVQLYARATSDTTITAYIWYPSDSLNFSGCGSSTDCDSPTAMPTQSQTYIVTVVNARGCSISDSVFVRVSNLASVFIPSAFTPNGDNLNDRFELDVLGATSLNVQIWDRWGERVYSNPDQTNGVDGMDGWDGTYRGKPVQFDTYTYQVVATYFDGHTETMSGTVTVMK